MADIQLGKAYVQIIPSAKGIKGMLSNEMEPEAREAGKKSGGSILSTMGKTIAAGAAVVAGAAAALVSESVKEYAEYEQLVGGAELMFGDAYDFVAEKAQNAYKTVQMSQSEYLAQANGFAVGLTNALGGNAQAAAELADKILTAEADIVAATGKDAESIQNAFNGIMRGNFTMLDNLGLGISGTKAGMQQVIDSVNKWNKEQGNATKYQMGNMADMEAALVDYVKMQGLAGYASMEASQTITGSLSSVKSAWQNVLVAMSDPNADMGKSIDALAETAGAFLTNVIPVAEKALKAIPDLVKKIAPVIIKELPQLVADLVPEVMNVIVELVNAIIPILPGMIDTLLPVAIDAVMRLIDLITTALPQIITTLIPAAVKALIDVMNAIIDALPVLIPAIIDGVLLVVDAIVDALPMLIDGIVEALPTLIQNLLDGLTTAFPALIDGAMALLMGIIDALPILIDALVAELPNIIQTLCDFLTENIPVILEAAITLLMALIDAIPVIIDSLLESLPDIINMLVNFLVENIPVLLDGAIQLLGAIIDAIPVIIKSLAKHLPGILTAIWNGLKDLGTMLWNDVLQPALAKIGEWISSLAKKALEAGKTFLNNVISFFKELPGNIYTWLLNVISKVVTWGKELGSKLLGIGENAVKGLWNGIKNVTQWIVDKVKGFGETVLGAIKGIFGIHSPSTVMAGFGEMLDLGFAKGITENADVITDAIDEIGDMATGTLQSEIMVNGSVRNPAAYTNPNSGMAALLDAVDTIAMRLNHMQIVLDSGALVGGISEQMDGALGTMQTQVKRGMLA